MYEVSSISDDATPFTFPSPTPFMLGPLALLACRPAWSPAPTGLLGLPAPAPAATPRPPGPGRGRPRQAGLGSAWELPDGILRA